MVYGCEMDEYGFRTGSSSSLVNMVLTKFNVRQGMSS